MNQVRSECVEPRGFGLGEFSFHQPVANLPFIPSIEHKDEEAAADIKRDYRSIRGELHRLQLAVGKLQESVREAELVERFDCGRVMSPRKSRSKP